MNRVSIITLGCRFNFSESEAMLQTLSQAGYHPEDDPARADVIIVNTCAVTTESERKARKTVRRVIAIRSRDPRKIVVVTGCYANLAPEEVAELQPELVLGNAEKGHILKWLARARVSNGKTIVSVTPMERQTTLQNLPAGTPRLRTRAFVRIQDGCQRWCSYCIIPLFRGKERSLGLGEVLDALVKLDGDGVPEAVLTGIHLASWGRDLNPRKTIKDLACAIADLPINMRVRWSSLEPEETTRPFLRAVLSSPHRFCPHFHLPLQSGSNPVLRRMKRGYTRERFVDLLHFARDLQPRSTFSTDIMVGFPGETERDFEETLEMIERCRFLKVHAFPYAPRPGTPASQYDPISDRLVRKRMTRLLFRAESIRREVILSHLGSPHTVLVEESDGSSEPLACGYSEYYIPAIVRGNHPAGTFVSGVATGLCGDRILVEPRPRFSTIENKFLQSARR
ncbi:MAG: tRNA (N(6)-L-threonylcarbamoyladenosine(37)-C(2))-methylthiotransferase MtaB [bacterium JZ-2024 1]